MTKATHTPGPWKLETVRTSCGICHKIGEFKRGTKLTAACVYDDYSSSTNPESQTLLANARLIAAAPELLAALVTLDNYVCNNLSSDYPTGVDVDAEAFKTARAAIAAATGAAA